MDESTEEVKKFTIEDHQIEYIENYINKIDSCLKSACEYSINEDLSLSGKDVYNICDAILEILKTLEYVKKDE